MQRKHNPFAASGTMPSTLPDRTTCLPFLKQGNPYDGLQGGICFSFHRNEYDITCSYHGPYHSLYHMHHLGTLPEAREPIATDIMISRHGPWHYSTCTLHASGQDWISKIFYYRCKEKKVLRPVLTGAPLVRCVPMYTSSQLLAAPRVEAWLTGCQRQFIVTAYTVKFPFSATSMDPCYACIQCIVTTIDKFYPYEC